MSVEIALILIFGKVAEKREMPGLRMNNRMRLELARAHLVMMDGKVRIEFTRHALERRIDGGEHPSGFAAVFDDDRSQVGSGRLGNIAQSYAGTGGDDCRSFQIGCWQWQVHDRHLREELADL